MGYGVSGIKLPEQNDELIRRMCYRWIRAVKPHNEWAEKAKVCVQFLEGEQWTPEEKAILRQMRRTSLTLNKIAPLYRLIMGYQSSNRLDVTFMPTSDARSSEDIATVLNNVFKSESNRTDLNYVDTDVFADGLATGRGYWDIKMDFSENDLGEVDYVAADPFAKYIDPDCNTYNIGESAAYIQDTVWTNVDAINERYGSEAALAVQNVMSPHYHSNILSYLGDFEVSPDRFFGGYADEKDMSDWADVYHTDFIDHQAKQVRLLDSQYKMESIMPCFIDLETGDKEPVPEEWIKNPAIIDKVLAYAEQRENPLEVRDRPVKRVRHTVTCGDIVLWDKWSIYKDYTTVGYFPYFRRGKTRGALEDLIDPQREINKKRSVLTDILNRNANSGWMYEENTLDADQEENLRRYGSSPGINVKYKRKGDGKSQSKPPQRIEPGNYPQGLDRLEEKSGEDLNEISGINQSALGQLDTVQSGRAIEARQRQAVLSIQMYSDNFSRSKKTQGRLSLQHFQDFYTEHRIYRILGEDSQLATYEINKKEQFGQNSVTRMNDITVGKYSVHVDEVPISATFKQAQFEETMMIIEKLGPIGMALAQTSPDLIIDQTSLPRKNDWKKALQEAQQQVDPALQQGAGVPAGAPPPAQPSTPEGVTG